IFSMSVSEVCNIKPEALTLCNVSAPNSFTKLEHASYSICCWTDLKRLKRLSLHSSQLVNILYNDDSGDELFPELEDSQSESIATKRKTGYE
ncbi:hypothetical protein L9F63_020280, partial [Diploptera punctata]